MKFQPVPLKRNAHYGSNYWEVYSPKIKRNVRLFSDLEYDHWVSVETNPQIKAFCEQPLHIIEYIDGKRRESIFDMWVQWTDETEAFIEVKYEKDLLSTFKNQRTLEQIKTQQTWCQRHGYEHVIQTEKQIRGNPVYLSNMKAILSYVKNYPSFIETNERKIYEALQHRSYRIGEIESTVFSEHTPGIRECICQLIYSGKLEANLDQLPFGLHTEVWLHA